MGGEKEQNYISEKDRAAINKRIVLAFSISYPYKVAHKLAYFIMKCDDFILYSLD